MKRNEILRATALILLLICYAALELTKVIESQRAYS